uniref:Uncharacterized protein n=1 Tax=Romanomermis culicivorax TaxID=13658 RepID=A0A915K0A3_ROMCU
MMNNYECNSCPITKFSAGMYCTKSIEGIYKRFKILRTSVDTAGNNILIMIDIDSGARIWCGTRGLCPLPLQFRYYQQQAISCRLFGLAPSSNDNQTTSWPESVVNYFKQFCGPTVQANVLNVCEKVTDDGSFTISMYKIVENRKIWAHEYLLSQNFAIGEQLIVVKDTPAKLYNF